MNPQDQQRQQMQALKDSVQSMSSWIQIKKSVLDAYSWKIQELRRQLRQRKWIRGSAPNLQEELRQIQTRYANLQASLEVEQRLLAENERLLKDYRRGTMSQSLGGEPTQSTETVSATRDRVFQEEQSLADSFSLSDEPTSILEPVDHNPIPDHWLDENTNSELFFQELSSELQRLTTAEANAELTNWATTPSSASIPERSSEPPTEPLSADWVEPVVELPQFDRLHLEEHENEWLSDDLHLLDSELAHLGDVPQDADGDFTGTFKTQQPIFTHSSVSSASDPIEPSQDQEVQQQIQRLEATIQQMASWIDQQQEELASYAWTVQDLRDRLKGRLNLRSSISIRQELDYVLQQHSSLEQSIQLQRQNYNQTQQQLDNYYGQLARIQSEQALVAAIAQTTAWVQQQQEELDAYNWKIQDLRHRLTQMASSPRLALELQFELDYALEQYSALEHSLYLQHQKLAEQQQQLKASQT
jgi:hypothetical protein